MYVKTEYNETIISHPAIILPSLCIEYGSEFETLKLRINYLYECFGNKGEFLFYFQMILIFLNNIANALRDHGNVVVLLK